MPAVVSIYQKDQGRNSGVSMWPDPTEELAEYTVHQRRVVLAAKTGLIQY